MSATIPIWVKPAGWGGVVGVGVVAIIGFSAGWVVTSGTSDEQAERRAEKAVIAALTPVCIAQFRKLSKEEEAIHLVALRKADFWNRGDYIEKQGWATMPGSKKSNAAVAEACAKELLKVVKK